MRGEEMSLLSSLLGGGGDSHSNFGAVLVCCCITCILRLPCWVNRALQWGHSYGFSPVWLNLWRFKWNESANALPHMSHENGRSPVCDLNNIFRTIIFYRGLDIRLIHLARKWYTLHFKSAVCHFMARCNSLMSDPLYFVLKKRNGSEQVL